ncbi:GNAT family N-acetyltransferase [bacterium]|nr:MAG: GNAT family N-acetyltransferase [bacterium]
MVPRPATLEDLPFILDLFDRRVEWLVAQGVPGQWGTEPVSAKESFAGRVEGWVTTGDAWVVDGLSAIVLSDAPPPYAAEGWKQNSIFLSGLITAPRPEARGLGRSMMAWAEDRLRAQGRTWLRLDCWADGDFLQGYYESMGFSKIGEFVVGPFRGAVMEKAL